jgi:hypothetical protein
MRAFPGEQLGSVAYRDGLNLNHAENTSTGWRQEKNFRSAAAALIL